jgi:hypothetical protein
MVGPKNIDEIAALAEADLIAPKRGVVLKWSLWHALAVGKRVAAEKACEYEMRLEFDAVCRREAQLPARAETESMLPWHQRNLEDVAAMEAACAHVLEMVRRLTAARQAPALPITAKSKAA